MIGIIHPQILACLMELSKEQLSATPPNYLSTSSSTIQTTTTSNSEQYLEEELPGCQLASHLKPFKTP